MKRNRAGTSFGEVALLENKRRNATVVCKEECKFAVLAKGPFQQLLCDIKMRETKEKLTFLENFAVFNYWKEFNMLTSNHYYMEERLFRRGEVIYKAGDPVNSFYLLKEGEVAVTQDKEVVGRSERDQFKQLTDIFSSTDFFSLNKSWQKKYNDELKEKITYVSKAPNYFGEVELVYGLSHRIQTVVCHTAVEVYLMPKERVILDLASRNKDFIPILKSECGLKETYVKELSENYKQLKITSSLWLSFFIPISRFSGSICM